MKTALFWSEWRDSNPRPHGPEARFEYFLYIFWYFLAISARLLPVSITFQLSIFQVLQPYLWCVLWSKPLGLYVSIVSSLCTYAAMLLEKNLLSSIIPILCGLFATQQSSYHCSFIDQDLFACHMDLRISSIMDEGFTYLCTGTYHLSVQSILLNWTFVLLALLSPPDAPYRPQPGGWALGPPSLSPFG